MSRKSLALAGLSTALLSCIGTPAVAQSTVPLVSVSMAEDKGTTVVTAPAEAPCTVCTPEAATALNFGGPWQTRAKLTGDWGGWRNDLANCHGITFNGSFTQFYQGVESGGRDNNYFYGARLDNLINIDGEKAGLMKGSFINLHAETLFGQSANFAAGTVLPVSQGQIFPVPNETVTALTGVKYTQFLSKNFAVFGGKLNTLDDFNQPYASGRGVDAFMNTSMCLPVVVARTLPYSTLGAGFVVLNDNQEAIFSFAALDTNNTPTNTGFPNFLDNGVVLMAQATLPVNFNGLPGHHSIGGTYSTGQYRSNDRNAYFDPYEGIIDIRPQEQGSWSIFYMFDQALFADCCNPKRTWGIFGNVGLADENPSPIRWAGNIGFGGASLATSRQHDTWGVGYFYNGLTQNIKDFAPRILPLSDESGVETFYNLGITPYWHFTTDFQVIMPGKERIDTTFVLGLRMKLDF
ncbi:MAG: carbohydrate porin [Gemmatales bacterium]